MKVSIKLPKWKGIDPNAVLLAAAGSLYRSASNIIADSVQNFVPVETGTLRSSGRADTPQIAGGVVTVTLGFGGPAAPYALKVHENPRSGKTGGTSPSGKKYRRWAKTGEWKYLETPFNAARPKIGPRLMRATLAARKQELS